MRCAHCGAELAPGDHFCKNCGKSIENNLEKVDRATQISSRMLKRTVIGVIAFAVVMIGMFSILVFMGTLSDVLERF
ncbi:MAG: zinc-ribbon domain-containing protein [Firmicutes bacterium]|nr:zinc-ribbon domain-containing protein [Bacillota bacterium]